MANNNNNDNLQQLSDAFCSWKLVSSESVFDAAPTPRYMHAVVSHGNYMFMFGGTGAHRDDKVWVYEYQQTKGVWTALETFNDESKPCARWGHTMNIVGDQLIVFGGWDNSSQFNDIFFLNLNTRTWREIFPGTHVPKYRSLHSSVTTHDGKIVIYGGAICVGGPYIYYDDVWVFDVKTEKFEKLKTTGESPGARAQHTAFLVDNHLMYIFGGCNEITAFNDVHVLNLQTGVWQKVLTEGTPPPTYDLHAQNYKISNTRRPGVFVDGVIFFVGGPSRNRKPCSNDMYIFDLETSTWRLFADSGELSAQSSASKPPVLGFHTLCLVSDCHKALLFGGTGPGMTSDSSVYVTDLNVPCLFRPKIPDSAIMQEFGTLLFQQRFSDFVFHIIDQQGQQKSIPAHKNILYARCSYFRAVLDSNMKEAQQGSMIIQDTPVEAFTEILKYLYTDQANVNPNNATDIILLASRYGLERLEKICEAVIMESLDDSTVCQILAGAEVANLTQLKKMCKIYILFKFGELVKTPQYQELPVEIKKELELKYLSQSTTRTNPFQFKL